MLLRSSARSSAAPRGRLVTLEPGAAPLCSVAFDATLAEGPEMQSRETCVDCKKQSPETETNYTLIGSRHGWRLSREKLPSGKVVVEWRCAECWKIYKATHGAPSGRHVAAPTSTSRSTPPSSSPSPSSSGRRPLKP